MIALIARHELARWWRSPLAWLLLALTQLLLAWIFLLQLEGFVAVQASLATLEGAPGLTTLVASPLLGAAATLFLLLLPLLAMRTLAGERQGGSLPLFCAAPVAPLQVVLGKYLGLFGFVVLTTALAAMMALSLRLGGRLDPGQLAAGLLGLLFTGATCAALALLVSGLAGTQAGAALGGTGLLLLLWLAGLGADGEGGLLSWISLQEHLLPYLRGVVRFEDLLYHFSITAAALALTAHFTPRRGLV